MRRDADGPHDVGLTVGLVTVEGEWCVGLQLGKLRCSLDEREALAIAMALVEVAEHIRLGTASTVPGGVSADAPAEVIEESLAIHRRRSRQ